MLWIHSKLAEPCILTCMPEGAATPGCSGATAGHPAEHAPQRVVHGGGGPPALPGLTGWAWSLAAEQPAGRTGDLGSATAQIYLCLDKRLGHIPTLVGVVSNKVTYV